MSSSKQSSSQSKQGEEFLIQKPSAAPRDDKPKLAAAERILAAAGIETARLDAELLMAAACDATRAEVVSGLCVAAPVAIARFDQFVARRAQREPLAYITGHREFYGIDLVVSPAVLIPRPETEALVDAALAIIARSPEARVLDLGTGSGCIAIAIAANAPRARIVAGDVSSAALEIARFNAERLGFGPRIKFVLGDLFDAVGHVRFDLIVSNPPYIQESAPLALEISRYEPRVALYAGADGLDFYRRLAAGVQEHLKAGGGMIVELGTGQAAPVAALLRAAGAVEVAVKRDLRGAERVAQARFHLSIVGHD